MTPSRPVVLLASGLFVLSGCGLIHGLTPDAGTGRIAGTASSDGGPPGATVQLRGVMLHGADGRRYVAQPLSSTGGFSLDVPAGAYTITAIGFSQCSTTARVRAGATTHHDLRCQAK